MASRSRRSSEEERATVLATYHTSALTPVAPSAQARSSETPRANSGTITREQSAASSAGSSTASSAMNSAPAAAAASASASSAQVAPSSEAPASTVPSGDVPSGAGSAPIG